MRRPILASYMLLVIFFVLSIVQRNMEFFIYAIVLIPVVALLHWTDGVFAYKAPALWGFSLWMLLHLLGGLASWHGVRLYDYMLIEIVGEPYLILKYDQAVHFYCYFIIAMLVSSIVERVAKKDASPVVVHLIVILAATGIGGFNEILEFLPVVLFNSPGPGGYINTAIDLIMNLLGAIAGALLYAKIPS